MAPFDLGKTALLLDLLKVPPDKRDDGWLGRFMDAVLEASLATPPKQVQQGPDGYPYFVLQTPPTGEPFEAFCVSQLLQHCTDTGCGLVINPKGDQADWVFSYGDLWALRAYGKFWGEGEAPPEAEPGGAVAVQGERKILLGRPAPEFFPDFARKIVASFLTQNGVKAPKVLLLLDQAMKPEKSLVFNLFIEDFGNEEEVQTFLQSLQWFFPRSHRLLVVPRDKELDEVFMDVDPDAGGSAAGRDPLWGWLGPDSMRLKRQGKAELASVWEGMKGGAKDSVLLRKGIALAAAAGEPWWELFFRHWYVQEILFREVLPLGEVLKEAAQLAAQAKTAACAGCPQRFCAHEGLFNAYFLVDPPGYAAEVARSAEELSATIPQGTGCKECFVQLRAHALIELGRVPEARKDLEALAQRSPDGDQNRFNASNLLAEAAGRIGDVAGMEAALEGARAYLRDPESGQPNEDNLWNYWELEFRLLLAQGRLGEAREIFQGRLKAKIPPESAEGVRIALSLARAEVARKEWGPARELATLAAERASARGMLRYAAEAALLAAEACSQSGDEAGRARQAASLAELLPRLKSRDLDAPAAAVGARAAAK